MNHGFTLFKVFVFIGTVICLMLVLFIANNDSNNSITVSSNISSITIDADNTSEPMGYFNGEWNLWEYIGDYIASHFKVN